MQTGATSFRVCPVSHQCMTRPHRSAWGLRRGGRGSLCVDVCYELRQGSQINRGPRGECRPATQSATSNPRASLQSTHHTTGSANADRTTKVPAIVPQVHRSAPACRTACASSQTHAGSGGSPQCSGVASGRHPVAAPQPPAPPRTHPSSHPNNYSNLLPCKPENFADVAWVL